VAATRILETSALTKDAGGQQILKGLDLDLYPGQVVGLLGKNGAGKSTLMDVLLGFALPTGGQSRVFGRDSARLDAATKARIGFVPQSDELMGLMTGHQHLALAASFYDSWDHELIRGLAQEWQVPLERRTGRMSGGERQKLATLMALGHRPEFLVMDEPASGLDPVARRQFMRTILDIASDTSRAILYSSASHVWVMREGRMLWRGELDVLKESVVRLHIRATREIDAALKLPGQLHLSVSGMTATATLRDWQPQQLEDLERLAGGRIEVETLGLEDIFLAMHS
jgi:ABC-2 type transport system ATP-binding protein